MEHVDGSTKILGIVGDPVSAVRSPQLFNALFRRHGINAIFVPLHVGAESLAAFWRGVTQLRNLHGLVVTMPHKAAAAGLVDRVSPAAQIAGGINAVRREPDGSWVGDMFDGVGFVDGLRAQGHEVAARRIHVLGLGGAGAAIAVALADAGARSLALHDRSTERIDHVIRQIQDLHPDTQLTSGPPTHGAYDIVINATPLGMKAGDPLPYDPATIPKSTLCVDIVTKPEMTRWLQAAASSGHRVHTGRYMHEGQAARAAAFFGLPID